MLNLKTNSKLDPISQVVNRVKVDRRGGTLDLSIGYYESEGEHHTGFSVLDDTKSSLPSIGINFSILGLEQYRDAVKTLITNENNSSHTLSTVQTIGASGGLWLAFLILKREGGAKRVWFSNPTWGNHLDIAKNTGLEIIRYQYDLTDVGNLNFNAVKQSLGDLEKNDILVVQGCCHNPCGIDFTMFQWNEIAKIAQRKSAYIVVDFAYFGLSKSFKEDKKILIPLLNNLNNLFVINSFSKNLGLYCERLGALSFFSRSKDEVQSFDGYAKSIIRSTYSMPPQLLAGQVAHVISNVEIFDKWIDEVAIVRDTLYMRKEILINTLETSGLAHLVSNTKSNGMFLNLLLSSEEIEQLVVQFGIYILGNGRLSLAGLQKKDINKLVEAISQVKTKRVF
ncbi:aspartate aminotransferase [Moritella sp. PE36]|uniref:aminotransferase class I/II-fold pyridoxal phosphate-dependent enzyme n=1 Tax=Moritella sp. PE36 TaxID=58051 RepID=UPI00015682F1|nr:aminotransferase class I/II-fold pyridoxal phosphate-dependent enzyme [Moritella sp. PE36]EDM67228.1 aspartate aminotransferase [Moritella sp. PE36]